MSFPERWSARGLLAGLCIAGCAALPATGGSPDVLRIGLLEDAGASGAMLRGAELAVLEINREGGVGGRNLELARMAAPRPWRDGARRSARLVFGGDLLALIGPADARLAHVAAQLATKRRIPIVTLSTDPSLTRAGTPWIFTGVTPDLVPEEPAAASVVEALGYDMVRAVAAAAHRQGTGPTAVRDGLLDGHIVRGRSGRFTFDPTGRRVEVDDENPDARFQPSVPRGTP